jgi:hypothetical protein
MEERIEWGKFRWTERARVKWEFEQGIGAKWSFVRLMPPSP